VQNQSGWKSDGFAVLLGLLSVQWTMTGAQLSPSLNALEEQHAHSRTVLADYDATAHISEEVKEASIRAPVAIIVAVLGTGIAGFVYNIVRPALRPSRSLRWS